MENSQGGWMLLSSHMDQNQAQEVDYKIKLDEVEDLVELMPQFVNDEDALGVYKLFRWKNRFTNLNTV